MLELTAKDYENLIEQYGDMRKLKEYIQNSKSISFFDSLYNDTAAFIKKYFNKNTENLDIEQKLDDKNFSQKDINLLKKIMFINKNFESSFNTHDSLRQYTRNRHFHNTSELKASSIIPNALTALAIQGELEDKDKSKIDALIETLHKYESVQIDKHTPVAISVHNIRATVFRRKLWYSAYKTTKNVQEEYKTNKIDIDQAISQLESANSSMSGLSMDPDIDWCYKKIDKLIKEYETKRNTPEF